MPPTIHVSEYDVGRAYKVTFIGENGNAFEIPTGTTATVEGTLNGTIGFTTSATISNNQISFALTESMTAYSGKAWCKIKLTLNDEPIQTCAFILAVDRAGVEAETVIGAPGFEEQIAAAAGAWMQRNAVSIIQHGVNEYADEHGLSPATEYAFTPQQFGAKADGMTDDTAAINACLASGASNIYFPKGTYLVDAHHAGFGHETEGGLRPKSNSVITLDADAVIKCATASTDFYNILHFVNVSNVIVQGGKIVGDKATHVQISQPTYEFGHGVGIQNSTNIVVRDMEISDCIGDGVILDYAGNADITLDNLTIHDCRRQGISLISGDGIVVSNCKIYDISGTNPQAGIDIEPDGNRSVTNVVITACNIRDTVGASVIVTNVSNVIDQIHITGCLLDHALFLGGSNVTMDGGRASKVSIKSEKAPMISACSIEEIAVSGGNSSFVGCNFTSSGKERFLTITSDVVSGNPAESIVFNDCDFNIANCTHFVFMPVNAIDRVKLLKFNNCRAKIAHALTSTYASSGIFNYLPAKTIISGSFFEFTAKIYQLFTAGSGSTVALEIIDSEILNSNEYRTNYLISGDATYDAWIDNSAFTKYGNMLYGGDSASGEIVLFNDRFVDFSNPTGKISADDVAITNVTRANIKSLAAT